MYVIAVGTAGSRSGLNFVDEECQLVINAMLSTVPLFLSFENMLLYCDGLRHSWSLRKLLNRQAYTYRPYIFRSSYMHICVIRLYAYFICVFEFVHI